MVPSLFPNSDQEREIATAKRKMRDAMMNTRRATPHASMASASSSIARHYADHPILSFCQSVAGYRAIRSELDVTDMMEEAQRRNRTTCLPRVTAKDKPLRFHTWSRGMPLVRHALGMEEPEAANETILPDLVLVPLLAFDGDGYRLGYGAGFYDRTMAELRVTEDVPPLFMGVGYNSQEVERVPTDSHDEPLDGIITEQGISMFNMMHPRVMV